MFVLQPEGEGKYVWADQSAYEGVWKVCTLAQHHMAILPVSSQCKVSMQRLPTHLNIVTITVLHDSTQDVSYAIKTCYDHGLHCRMVRRMGWAPTGGPQEPATRGNGLMAACMVWARLKAQTAPATREAGHEI